MKIVKYNSASVKKKNDLLLRPSIDMSRTYGVVQPILNEIKKNGQTSIIKFAKKFDGLIGKEIKIKTEEIEDSDNEVSSSFKKAIKTAALNITKFHKEQFPKKYTIETMPGIKCSREYRSIDNVGLYIPGGTAILPSTLLMLGIPAKIAGCKRIVVCTPAGKKMNPEVLYTAKYLGIKEIYRIGGAQAIGLMAYGTKNIARVNKIFGPGNQYVTAAKALVSIDPEGCEIDMIAGPSEVLVIADDKANPNFIAADLLSQAEHGVDSQVIFCTTSETLAQKVNAAIEKQTELLERKDIVRESLKNSFSIIFNSIDDAIKFSNEYAPEHLILNFEKANSYKNKISNAGSVFIGKYSPESAGDYASGTNHSLPTYGYAKSTGGVTVEQFMKSITFQNLSKKGLSNISQTIVELAETEGLSAHANAVKIRFKDD